MEWTRENWKVTAKWVVGAVCVYALWLFFAEKQYESTKLLAKVSGFIFGAVAFYFPSEVSGFTGYQRYSSSDWRFMPESWVELCGFLALMGCVVAVFSY